MIIRIFLFFVLVLSTVWAPVYISLVLFALFATFYNRYYEGLVAGLFLDVLYFSSMAASKYHIGFFTFCFLLVFLFLQSVKKKIEARNVLAHSIIATSGIVAFVFLFFCFLYLLA